MIAPSRSTGASRSRTCCAGASSSRWGRLEEARASFLSAETLDPTFVEAQYYLGIVHERFNDAEEALTRYQRAMQLDPANAQYVVAAGEMLVHLGRVDEAERMLEQHRTGSSTTPPSASPSGTSR